jgi:ribosomal protein L18E
MAGIVCLLSLSEHHLQKIASIAYQAQIWKVVTSKLHCCYNFEPTVNLSDILTSVI